MLKDNVVLLFVAVFLCGVFLPGLRDEAGAGGIAVIPKVNLAIPASMDDKTREQLIGQLNALERQRFVYLDLSINFSDRADMGQPFTLIVNGKPQARQGCAVGTLPMGAGVHYDLHGLAGYNHLLISVFTGARSAFPYLDVACEYTRSGQENQVHIRGFFHVLANAVPTAVSLQLRPFTPAFDVARKILSR